MKKNKTLSVFNKFLLCLNFILVFALLISYLATVVNPSSFWLLAFFGLAYPFILLFNCLFIILWAFKRQWFALISLAAILIGINQLKSTFAFNGKHETSFMSDSNSIKIMTYNVHYFKKFGSDLDSSTRTSILNLIDREQPDVLGFQEFFTRRKGKYDIKDSLFRILKTNHFYFYPTSQNDYEATGIALFSKFPIIKAGRLTGLDDNGANNGIWVDIKKGNKVFRTHVVHLASVSFQPEDYMYLNKMKKEINTTEDLLYGKKIVSRLKHAFIRRGKQVNMLKNYTDTCKTPYIIMGDFNDTPVSYTLNTLGKNMKNSFYEKGSGFGITYNGEFPNFQIDYILATPEFEVETYKIIKESYSDHYPVRASLSLKDVPNSP